MRAIKIMAAAAAAAMTFAIAACGTSTEPPASPATTVTASTPATTTPQAKPKPKPTETTAQHNARETAKSYLDPSMGGFSEKGLAEQLKFEGYAPADISYAINALHPDWMRQAELKAKSYQETQPYSRSGLVDQLKFEGFTDQQATHGADSVGL